MSDGVIIAVRVTARAGRDAVEGVDASGQLRLRVSAPPVDGAANKAVLRLVAKALGVPRSAVTIAAGAGSRHKRIRVDGLDAGAVSTLWPGVNLGLG